MLYGSTIQEGSATNQLTFLEQLVGQKCSVHLKNGEVIHGTLWDYGDDYVSLKIKKGLLYSKTEKYAASEIDYLKDSQANRYYMPGTNRSTNEKPPTRLYINPDNVKQTKNSESQEFQGPLRFSSKNEKKRESSFSPPSQTQKTKFSKTKPAVSKKRTPTVSKRTLPTFSQKTQRTQSLKPAPTPKKQEVVTNKPKAGTPDPATYFTETTSEEQKPTVETTTTSQDVPQIPGQEIQTMVAKPDTKQLKILQYQMFVLLGAAVFIIALTIFFKSSTYGKHSLFPAQLIKIHGHYAIIDQGKEDGVKLNDLIRLYKKSGRQIEYKAKLRVRKVGENYSAVELIKLKSYLKLEVGDVGFRDRSWFTTSVNRSRIIISAVLRGLAKGLQYAAKIIDVNFEKPAIDLPPVTGELDEVTVKTIDENPGSQARERKMVTTVKSSNSSKPMGFGLEPLES